MENYYRLTYVSNAGVLIELCGKKILIDGLCNSLIPIYKNPSPEIKKQIILGLEPFNNIDIILITHNHSDHFDLNSMVKFLKNNKKTTIISTKEVITLIQQNSMDLKNSKLITLNPRLHYAEKVFLNGISIEGISTLHDGKQYEDMKNLTFLIEVEGKKVLHLGDAKPTKENYSHLDLVQKNIDLLLAPFSYVGVPTGRRIIERYIKAKKIAAIHLPIKELDKNGWIATTKKSYKRVESNFIETVFLEEIGEIIDL